MSNQAKKSHKKVSLHVLNPDLPFLASEAAIELDNLLLGIESNFEAVTALKEMLRNSFEVDGNNGVHRSILDPTTLTVLGDAINSGQNQPLVTKADELFKKACSIADDLSEIDNPENNRERLEWTRAFCVALSRLTAAYHESIFDLAPPHPFRR